MSGTDYLFSLVPVETGGAGGRSGGRKATFPSEMKPSKLMCSLDCRV
jgi:hypothetical protein